MLLASGVRAGRGVVRFARELFFFNLSIHGRADVSLFVECPPPRFALSSGEHMPTQQHAWWRPRLRSLAAVRSDHTEHCGVGHPRDACFYILSTWSSMISVGFRHLSTKWLCHSTPPGGSDAFTRYPGGAECGVWCTWEARKASRCAYLRAGGQAYVVVGPWCRGVCCV